MPMHSAVTIRVSRFNVGDPASGCDVRLEYPATRRKARSDSEILLEYQQDPVAIIRQAMYACENRDIIAPLSSP